MTEFMCMINFMKHKHPFWFIRSIFPFWVNTSIIQSMKENAGFFSPNRYKGFCDFSDLYYNSTTVPLKWTNRSLKSLK